MKSKIISYLIVSLFLFSSFVQAQNEDFKSYKWQTVTCVGEPIARHEAAFVASNGKFYLMGSSYTASEHIQSQNQYVD